MGNDEDMAADMNDLKALVTNMAQLLLKQSESKVKSDSPASTDVSMASLNAIESRIQEFVYSPEDGSTFERWWNRHEDIFMIDLKEMDEVKKIRLLIRHVSTSVERTFVESIAPKKWLEMSLEDTKDKMLALFGDNTSIFDRRRTMLDLKMSRQNIEDVRVLAARVNQTVENAQVKDATIDEWKVLTFLHSLDLPRYSDVHLKMMQTAKQKGKTCTLDDLLSVFNDVAQLKKDSRAITESSHEVNYVDRGSRKDQKYKKYNRENGRRDSSNESEGRTREKRAQCKYCGSDRHSSDKCKVHSSPTTVCYNCGLQGHIARMCKKTKKVNTVMVASVATSAYSIPVKINDVPMSMMLDTGADITIITEKTWKLLGMPDCLTTGSKVVCANGNDLAMKGRFRAKMEYGGMSATDEVHVTYGDRDILGKNFINSLQLVQVRTAKVNVVEAREPGMEVSKDGVRAPATKMKQDGVRVPASKVKAKEAKAPMSAMHREEIRNPSKKVKLSEEWRNVNVEWVAEQHRYHHTEDKVRVPEKKDTGGDIGIFLQESTRDSERCKEKNSVLMPMSDGSRNGDNPAQSDRLSDIDEEMERPSEDENNPEKSDFTLNEKVCDHTPNGVGRCQECSEVNNEKTPADISDEKGKVMNEKDENRKKQSTHANKLRIDVSGAHQTELSYSELLTDKMNIERNDPVMDQRDEFKSELKEVQEMELSEWDKVSGSSSVKSSPINFTASPPLRHHSIVHPLMSWIRNRLPTRKHRHADDLEPQMIHEGKPQKKKDEGKPRKKTCTMMMKQ